VYPRSTSGAPEVVPGKEGAGGAHRGRRLTVRWRKRLRAVAFNGVGEAMGSAVMKVWPCSSEEEGRGEVAP
jgi:hypothetical protein